MMDNWRLVDSMWMNFDNFNEIWVDKLIAGQIIIKARNLDDEIFELFDRVFDTEPEAEQFLVDFMVVC